MNVLAAAQSFNENAIRHNWNHVCDPSLAFSDPSYEKFIAIWRAKAGAHGIAARSQMTARDLKDFLRDISLVQSEEIDGVSHYRWRLIGTNIHKIVGHQTGKLFDESIPAEHLARWIDVCNMVRESGQPWRFLGRVHIRDREYLDAENLYVPLADDNGVPSFVMGYCRFTSRYQDDDTATSHPAVIASRSL